jgi:flavin reductase (DIM6/NTAB) family NADH-FMN oxidoreductase RutF
MEKMNFGRNVFIYPMPVTLLGTKMGGTANFMALGWLTRVNSNPPLLAVGVNNSHLTNGLSENKTFSINFPSADLIQKVDIVDWYLDGTKTNLNSSVYNTET